MNALEKYIDNQQQIVSLKEKLQELLKLSNSLIAEVTKEGLWDLNSLIGIKYLLESLYKEGTIEINYQEDGYLVTFKNDFITIEFKYYIINGLCAYDLKEDSIIKDFLDYVLIYKQQVDSCDIKINEYKVLVDYYLEYLKKSKDGLKRKL